jgi:hypothetical protein
MKLRIDEGGSARLLPVIACASLLVAAAAVHGCKDIVAETLLPAGPDGGAPGQIGDLCTPTFDTLDPSFPGYAVAQINVEDHFGACASGICLANHFQGRVTCPLGQPAPTPCAGPGDPSCGAGRTCATAGPFPDAACDASGASSTCESGVCNPDTHSCTCSTDGDCPGGMKCDPGTEQCAQYVCETTAGCQSATASDADNAGKACCLSGPGSPVTAEVCGQCAEGSGRSAAEAVYCSCRCGLAAGDTTPDAGPFCACPDGFTCSEVVSYVGLGDESLTGKYCIKQGTAYTSPDQCGQVRGYFDPATCSGVGGN